MKSVNREADHLARLSRLMAAQEEEVREALAPVPAQASVSAPALAMASEVGEGGAAGALLEASAGGQGTREPVKPDVGLPKPVAPLERRLLEVLDPFVTGDPHELRVLVPRLGLPTYLPANTMLVDDDAWQRLMSMRTRTGLTMTALASYLLAVVTPKPTAEFAAQWVPRYDDLHDWLRPVLAQGRAVSSCWHRPAWLEVGEETPTGIRHPVRYIEHPYIALRLAELETHTGLRGLCLTLAVKRFFPPSTVKHSPKRRRR